MYSRFSGNRESSVQIPEHYSGWAFSRTQSEKKPAPSPASKPPPAYLEVGKPTYVQPPQSPPMPPPVLPKEDAPSEMPTIAKEEKPTLPAPFAALFGNMGSSFPFSHGIGFEELLILGLIILLARNEGDTDTMLLIGLLLFCG